MAANPIARLTCAADEWAADWLTKIETWESTARGPTNTEQARRTITAIHDDANRRSRLTDRGSPDHGGGGIGRKP
jgi:hypothetical protein